MNKYQEALDWVRTGNDSCGTEWDFLQELVDKSIPMKPLHISLLTNPPKNIIVCGNCKLEIIKVHKHCSKCGQKIDWSDND